MALFFGLAQVYSRQLKSLDVSLTNAFTGLFGFIILLILSYLIEGNTVSNIKLIKRNWESNKYLGLFHLLFFFSKTY